MNFAEALGMLLDELNATSGVRGAYTNLEMSSESNGVCVWFSNPTIDTNEYHEQLICLDKNDHAYFWTPSPLDILATDWVVKDQ